MIPPSNSSTSSIDPGVLDAIRAVQTDHIPFKVSRRVINLDRRPDRLQRFLSAWPGVQRHPAVDGESVVVDPSLVRLFGFNAHNWNKGVVGCALSHLSTWQDLLRSDCSAFFVLEDDAEHTPLTPLLDSFIQSTAPMEYDILFLGYTENHHNWAPPGEQRLIQVTSFDTAMQWFMGGAFAYLITRRGAQRMLSLINAMGMVYPIDTMMLLLVQCGTVIWCTQPFATSRVCSMHDENPDTDIQHNIWTRPIQGTATVRLDHLNYIFRMSEKYGFRFVFKKEEDDELKPDTTYVLNADRPQFNVQVRPTHAMYWMTQYDAVHLPLALKEAIEKEEGIWRVKAV